MSFSCGRVVQFVIVGPLHRKRSEGADDDERTTIRSQRERSELRQTPTKTLQPQCQPQAGARLPPRKTKTKTINENENPKRKPQTKTVLALVTRSRLVVEVLRAAGGEARLGSDAVAVGGRPEPGRLAGEHQLGQLSSPAAQALDQHPHGAHVEVARLRFLQEQIYRSANVERLQPVGPRGDQRGEGTGHRDEIEPPQRRPAAGQARVAEAGARAVQKSEVDRRRVAQHAGEEQRAEQRVVLERKGLGGSETGLLEA